MYMADHTKTSGGGLTQLNGEKTDPVLNPSVRPVFQNAGFDDEVIEGAALDAGHGQGYGLRDGDNSQSDGTQPKYGQDIVDSVFLKGQDLRNKEK
jgi:hypothetical protein